MAEDNGGVDQGDVDGIDRDAVEAWLGDRTEIQPPLTIAVVEGGRSNLTYRLADRDGRRFVLRRPPLHSVLESAHDVAREHRLMAALQETAVPVPPVIGVERDDAVNGAPFYVMEFVDGPILRDASAADQLDEAARRRASERLVDVLVDLHAIDPDEVGLGDLAKREDYLARQLHRWHGQFQKGSERDIPLIDEVHDRLVAEIPEQQGAAIVHGDFRLDNMILSPDGDVRAVLDWELCTLGDPLADVGLLMVYWSEPGDETMPLLDSPTVRPGFATRDEIAARYAERSGRDLGELPYYVAFGYWKLACILEGVYTRFSKGAYAHEDAGVQQFGDLVHRLAERAAEETDAAGR